MSVLDRRGVGRRVIPLRGVAAPVLPAWARAARGLLVRLRGFAVVWGADVLALAFLALSALFLFRDALDRQLLFHEADTTTMFYPVFAAFHDAVERRELLLWSPDLFSGFPLLAEGQTGVLYPLNWALALLLPTAEGFVWQRVGHFVLAAGFSYLFGRALQLVPPAATVLALSFTFGSFMIGQLQHQSVIASAVWMPLVLALTELGFRARGRARHRLFLLAGLALAMSALGVHMQTVAMEAGAFTGWVLFRIVVPPSGAGLPARSRKLARSGSRVRPRRAHGLVELGRVVVGGVHGAARGLAAASRCFLLRLLLGLWALLVVAGVSMAVAAPQLLPLYELSQQSGRAGVWTYQLATDYSLPVENLATLVFPFFFRDGRGGGWSLWQPWEVTYYAGVVPLALATLAVLFPRRREIVFFFPLLVVVTLLALGDYSPLNLYTYLWTLPGMNLQRAPARYSYLGVFAIAALAGIGTQTLWETLRVWPTGARPPLRWLVLWLVGLVAGLLALLWHLVAWRSWLENEPFQAMRYLEQVYLAQRHDPGAIDSVEQAYNGLWRALDLTNPHTALPLLLLVALVVLVICWNEVRRFRALWQALLIGLVTVDLLSFAQAYHPQVSLERIADIGGAGRFLTEQEGPVRIITHPAVERPKANQLLPWGIDEAQAYDPLELSRHRVYSGVVNYVDNWLLDLLGVRFRVLPANPPALPSYRQTGFNPQHPLVSGGAANPAGREAWQVPGDAGDEFRVVSALEDAWGVADGEPVAEWILTDDHGRQRVITMVAGRDTADWTYDDPVNVVPPAHSRAQVAFSFDLPTPLPGGARSVHLYYAAFPLEGRPRITRVEFRQTMPVGRVQVYGFGLFDRASGQMYQFYDREKYRVVYRDGNVTIQENQAAFPRAFAVPEAVVVPSAEDALTLLTEGPFQPRRQVILEAADTGLEPRADWAVGAADGTLGEPYGDVQLVEYGSTSVTVSASTDGGYLVLTDASYPGWKAFVDGQEQPIYRADYLFRAVQLPPGAHTVEFRYEPATFTLGVRISLGALVLALLGLIVTTVPLPRLRRSPRSEARASVAVKG